MDDIYLVIDKRYEYTRPIIEAGIEMFLSYSNIRELYDIVVSKFGPPLIYVVDSCNSKNGKCGESFVNSNIVVMYMNMMTKVSPSIVKEVLLHELCHMIQLPLLRISSSHSSQSNDIVESDAENLSKYLITNTHHGMVNLSKYASLIKTDTPLDKTAMRIIHDMTDDSRVIISRIYNNRLVLTKAMTPEFARIAIGTFIISAKDLEMVNVGSWVVPTILDNEILYHLDILVSSDNHDFVEYMVTPIHQELTDSGSSYFIFDRISIPDKTLS